MKFPFISRLFAAKPVDNSKEAIITAHLHTMLAKEMDRVLTPQVKEFFAPGPVSYVSHHVASVTAAAEALVEAEDLQRATGYFKTAMRNLAHLERYWTCIVSARGLMPPQGIVPALIEHLKEADSLDCVMMTTFRNTSASTPDDVYEEAAIAWADHGATPKEMHACGTTACLSGHLRILPAVVESWSIRPRVTACDLLAFNGRHYAELDTETSTSILLGVPEWFAEMMIYDRIDWGNSEPIHKLYRKPFDQVRASDIIHVLEQIQAGVNPERVYATAQLIKTV